MCVPLVFSCLFSLLRDLGELMEEAGWVCGWQLVGVLISRSNQKSIVREAGKIKAGLADWGCAVCSAKAQESVYKAARSSKDALQLYVLQQPNTSQGRIHSPSGQPPGSVSHGQRWKHSITIFTF